MLKIEIKNPEEKILECEFLRTDYPLINLFFKHDELKTKIVHWRKEGISNEKMLNNNYLIDITVSENFLHRIADETSLENEIDIFSGYHLEQVPVTVRAIVADIIQCSCRPKFKKLYLKTKISELLIQILSAAPEEFSELRWTEQERNTFKQLKDLIGQDLRNNYSIEDLAQIAGMNRTKMQAGFKDLFGQTIYAYILDLKMLEAKTLLSKVPKASLKEIASMVGYKHTTHFSTAFKKKYTFPPSFFKKGLNLIGTLFFAFS